MPCAPTQNRHRNPVFHGETRRARERRARNRPGRAGPHPSWPVCSPTRLVQRSWSAATPSPCAAAPRAGAALSAARSAGRRCLVPVGRRRQDSWRSGVSGRCALRLCSVGLPCLYDCASCSCVFCCCCAPLSSEPCAVLRREGPAPRRRGGGRGARGTAGRRRAPLLCVLRVGINPMVTSEEQLLNIIGKLL